MKFDLQLLVYGIKWWLTTVKKYLKYDEIVYSSPARTTVQLPVFRKGYGKASFYPIYVRHIQITNLFLTLVRVKSFGKIVAKRAKDKDYNPPFSVANFLRNREHVMFPVDFNVFSVMSCVKLMTSRKECTACCHAWINSKGMFWQDPYQCCYKPIQGFPAHVSLSVRVTPAKVRQIPPKRRTNK